MVKIGVNSLNRGCIQSEKGVLNRFSFRDLPLCIEFSMVDLLTINVCNHQCIQQIVNVQIVNVQIPQISAEIADCTDKCRMENHANLSAIKKNCKNPTIRPLEY